MTSKEENVERELLARTEKLDKLIKENLELKTKELKADEMFEELGYKKSEHIYHIQGFVVEYDDGTRQIDFMNETKEIKIWNITTDMQELQAINAKVKELGWL